MKKKDKKKRVQLDPFHVRYRPQTLGEVIGQASAVTALQNLDKGRTIPHSFLFTGPSGVGKTTLARLLGKSAFWPVDPPNVMEIDAATNSGVDDMRQIKGYVETPAFGGNPRRLLIIDECHSLSKNAWQSWLKIIEEPPKHLRIAFCTTEAAKVPKTIKTRCHTFNLSSVPMKPLIQLLDEVLFAEQEKLPNLALRAIANKADGSVRQALVYLSMCIGCKDKAAVLRTLDEADEEGDLPIEICRAIVRNDSFWKVLPMIQELETDNVEGIRILTCNYVAKALLGMKKNKEKAGWLLEVLEELSEPFNPALKKAPLILAAGRLLF